MEAKYYTPSLEEFYIGFEYEFYYHPLRYKDVNNSCFWEKRVYTGKDFAGHRVDGDKDYYDAFLMLHMEDCALGINELIRVKYLDTQDIEECGFEFHEEENEYIGFIKKYNPPKHQPKEDSWYEIIMYKEEIPYIKIVDNYLKYEEDYRLFAGIIKNKSELKKILKMLNIK